MIICNNCMKKFKDDSELVKLKEIQISSDDIIVIEYDFEELEDNEIVFDGCPNCLTDSYLMDIE